MADTLARGVIELYGDASQLEASFARAEAVAKRTEAAVVQSAGRTGAATGKAGAEAAAGTEKMAQAARRYALENERQRAQLTLDGPAYQAWLAARKKIPEALVAERIALQAVTEAQKKVQAPSVDYAKQLGLVGVSAGQASAALRGLPAQFTDIATSLQGGQNPLTVFLQQGGQIKDQFGGVGNALKALGTVLTPARLLLGGAAAAVGVLGLAYRDGAKETDEYRRALALTNNTAGTTIGQLQAMAQAVSALAGGTQGNAAEVLTALAGSAKVAARDLASLTAAAIRLERAGGPAALETAKAFAALADSPTQAAVALSKSTGFLTAAVYEQARALELQGRTSEAASVVQRAAAESVANSAKTLEAGLGTLEKAWRGVGDVAKAAWDAMAGSGRPETAESRLKQATTEVERARAALEIDRGSGRRTGTRQAALDVALERQGVAQSDDRTSQMAAQLAAIRAESAKAAIEFSKLAETVKSPGKALQEQLAQVKTFGAAAVAAGTATQEQVDALAKRIAARSPFNAATVAVAQAQLAAEGQLAADQLTALQSRIQLEGELKKLQGSSNPLARLNDEIQLVRDLTAAQVAASRAEEDRLEKARRLAERLPDNQAGVVAADAAVKAQRRKTEALESAGTREVTLAVARQAAAVRDLARVQIEENDAAIQADLVERAAATSAAQRAVDDYAASVRDSVEASRLELSLIGESQSTRRVQIEQLRIELDARRRIAELQATKFAGDTQADRERARAIEIAKVQASAAIAKADVSARIAVDQAPLDAASSAVKDYLADIAKAGAATRDALKTGLSSLEDDLTQSLATGKFSVKRTVDYIIQEFLRLSVIRPLLRNLLGGAGGGGAGGLLGLFGGGAQAAFSGTSLGASGFGTGLAYGNLDLGAFIAKGGAFDGGRIALASGGVLNSATGFSSGGKQYVAGEAGPEGILPLRRTPDGRLGVTASGSSPSIVNNVTVNGDVSPQTVALLNAALAKNNAQLVRGLKLGTVGA